MVKWSLRYKQVLFHALNKYWLDTDFYSTISGAVGHRGGLVRQALVMYRNRWTGKTQNKGGRRKKQDVDDLAWAQHGADSPQWSSDPPAGVPTSRLQPGTCCQISSGIRWEIKGGGGDGFRVIQAHYIYCAISPTSGHGKIVFHEIGPGAKKMLETIV